MTWSRSHSVLTTASDDQIWRRWTDPTSWALDDPSVEWARFDADPAPGTVGRLKNHGLPSQKFVFTDVRRNRRMDFAIALPWGRLSITHEFVPIDDALRVTHGVVIDGALTPLYVQLIGRGIASGLPEVVRRVVDGALSV